MSLAQYYFIPTVREGLAAYITGEATGERAEVDTHIKPLADGVSVPEDPAADNKKVSLYGPSDVLGLDESVVVRTDPRRNVWDYEPNFMPTVEFSEPDLPWRFTPAAAMAPQESGRLTPWLTLIVLRSDTGEYKGLGELSSAGQQKNTQPVRWIKSVDVSALPDLSNAWMWAHVQVTAESRPASESTEGELRDALIRMISMDPTETNNHHVVSRLICPRRLSPKTHYTAFIVPTFKLGLVAAGLEVPEGNESALTPAWGNGGGNTVDLPYYFKWEFATSLRGDFEYLARLLQPRKLTEHGKRPMDCTSTLYGLPQCPGSDDLGKQVLGLEGALISPNLDPAKWRNNTSTEKQNKYQNRLADLLNLPVTLLTNGNATPPVTPPVFGRRHSGSQTVNAGALSKWQNDANLDPRLRAAAGFGALVVQKEQEPLMAALWDQLGDIDEANEILRRGQLGMEASKSNFKRLGKLDLSDFLWTAAPVLERVPFKSETSTLPTTVSQCLERSPIPSAAFDHGFRRMLRRRGGMRKRQRQIPKPADGQDLLSRLNNMEISAAGTAPTPAGMPSIGSLTEAAIAALEKQTEPQRKAKGNYRINGRVVDYRNHRGIAGLKVEVWDKDPFQNDLLGCATTNERGTFRVEFNAMYFQAWRFDPKPDVFFKLFQGRQPVAVAEPKVLRNLPAGDTDVVVAVKPPEGWEILPAFRIAGRVIDRATRSGVPFVRVEAWDKDLLLINDLVGSAVTDEQGAFSIEFEQSYFKEWFLDPKPDLFFKVYQRDNLLVSTEQNFEKDVPPGETNIVVEIDTPVTPVSQPGQPVGAYDFCEEAITCEALKDSTVEGEAQLHSDTAEMICGALKDWLNPAKPEPAPPLPVDLQSIRETVKKAITPWVTIPARIGARIKLSSGVYQHGVLGRIESKVEFPQPMYESLAAISQDLILPGVETVPQNTVSILKTNRRFMEAYMLGLNDSMSNEALWRGAPVYLWTTFFRQFWDVQGLIAPDDDPELSRDIAPLTKWGAGTELKEHYPQGISGPKPPENSVVLVRGDLLNRYPNTLIYAVESLSSDEPALDEYQIGSSEDRLWPVFSGSLPPDLTFLGFSKSTDELRSGGSNNKGYFIVFEERLGEPRFGLDQTDSLTPEPLRSDNWWYNLNWENLVPVVAENAYINSAAPEQPANQTPRWGSNAATIANICLQRPVRIAIHASKMLPGNLGG